MDRSNSAKWVFGAWLGAIAIISLRRIVDPSKKGLPPPGQYLGSGVLFTLLWLLSLPAPNFAAVLAVSTDVGMLVAPVIQGQTSTVPLLDSVVKWLNQVSGGTPG